MRLQIAVLITMLALPFSVSAEDWVFDVYEDPLTDVVRTYAAKDGLVMYCENGGRVSLSVKYPTSTLLKSSVADVIYRFDKDTPITKEWDTTADGQSIVAPFSVVKSFVRSVFTSEKVFIRATDYRDVPTDLTIYLGGANEDDISNFADKCGVEVETVDPNILTAMSQFSTDTAMNLDNYGPKSTLCLKTPLNILGYVKDVDVNSAKDVEFYNSVFRFLETYPKLCEDRKKLKIKGLKSCKTYTIDSFKLFSLYSIGKEMAEDPKAFKEMCGSIRIYD